MIVSCFDMNPSSSHNPSRSPGNDSLSTTRTTPAPEPIMDYSKPEYLDNLVLKYDRLGKIPQDILKQPHIVRSFAFSLAHPRPPTTNPPEDEHEYRRINLQIFIEANIAAHGGRITNAYGAYSVAYSPTNRTELPDTYGHSAPQKKTRPTVSTLEKAQDLLYRTSRAYPPDGVTPKKMEAQSFGHCAEFITLPPLVEAAREYYKGQKLLIYVVTLSGEGHRLPFCRNCREYVVGAVQKTPGLCIVDGVTEQKYESLVGI